MENPIREDIELDSYFENLSPIREKLTVKEAIGYSAFASLMGIVSGAVESLINPKITIDFIREIKDSGIKEIIQRFNEAEWEGKNISLPAKCFFTSFFLTYSGFISNHIYNFSKNPEELSSQIPIYTNLASAAIQGSWHLIKKGREKGLITRV